MVLAERYCTGPSEADVVKTFGYGVTQHSHLFRVYRTLATGSVVAILSVLAFIKWNLKEHVPASWSFGAPVFCLLAVGVVPIRDERQRFGVFCLLAFSKGLRCDDLIEIALKVDPELPLVAALVALVVFTAFCIAAIYAKQRSMLYLAGTLHACLGMLLVIGVLNFWLHSPFLYVLEVYVGLVAFGGFTDRDNELAETTIEDLRVQLAKCEREIAAQKAQIDKLKKFQSAPTGTTATPIAMTPAAVTPLRPPMNALLGQIQAGKALKTAGEDVPVRPAGSPAPGGLLAAIQGGVKLKKAPTTPTNKPDTKAGRPSQNALLGQIQAGKALNKVGEDDPMRPAGSPPPGGLLAAIQGGVKLKKASTIPTNKPDTKAGSGPALAELCQLKAKQRTGNSQRIDDLLANKKVLSAASSKGPISELQAALARRKTIASAAS